MDRRERRNSLVYLTGFMGSGKSTIGPILANTLGYDFVDTDRAVERALGTTVHTLFLEQGEERFRNSEQLILRDISSREHVVVSLGGGTMVDAGNRRIIAESGLTIYLKSSPAQIFRRVRSRTDRPLLLHPDGSRMTDELLQQRIDQLYYARESVYETADVTIPVDEKKVGETVDEIVRRISSRLR